MVRCSCISVLDILSDFEMITITPLLHCLIRKQNSAGRTANSQSQLQKAPEIKSGAVGESATFEIDETENDKETLGEKSDLIQKDTDRRISKDLRDGHETEDLGHGHETEKLKSEAQKEKEEMSGEIYLAVLLIIIDDLPHEAIWRLWEEHFSFGKEHATGESNTSDIAIPYEQKRVVATAPVRFLIHAKYPERVNSQWVKERLVPFHLMPSWGSLLLTEVMIKMLHQVD